MLASASDLRVIAEVSTIAAGGATGRQMVGEASEAVARTARPPRFAWGTRRSLLMRDKFNLAFIDVGGWDTHVNEGSAQGQLSNLLGNLGQGLSGFAQQMGPAWTSTLVVVISEFGRTFRENGTRGTDHGHGTAY